MFLNSSLLNNGGGLEPGNDCLPSGLDALYELISAINLTYIVDMILLANTMYYA